ncbi:Transcription factor TFIIIB component B'' [Schistosoma japonicum]|uniref:Transcription factor TFIIIB component B n=2 Tax=Schistosoma japonicum TaxID=6182 RepID=A0A4Z2DEN2_SCHJA|nr:Transcription factor TFIIIB component B'' [Schistosoma japonicum]TNN14971.1 Transcription factor TFIIIB component B'' [Schistosoma japonicum]
MPKVFRPSIKQVKAQIKTNEVRTQEIEHNQVLASQSVEETSPCTVESTPDISSPFPPQDFHEVSETDTRRSTDLDLDVHVNSENTQQISKEIVNLFVSKKPRKVKVKTTEILPPVDQPLDRASVTLRSLLHWVPVNKPPPTYRQERLNSTTCSVSGDVEAGDPDDKSPEENTKISELEENSTKCPSTDVYSDPLAPQLRLDANGNIVLDETSLLVGKRENVDVKTLRHINEETGILNVDYNSFRPPRDRHGRKWSERETTRFYRALSTIGTDFYLMEKMFPHRKRPELVSKFKREEKRNPYLVNQALRNRRTYDLINLLPSSDEEENPKPDKSSKYKRNQDSVESNGKSCDQNLMKTSKPKSRGKSLLRRDPDFESHLSETIDYVLSQFANSNSCNLKCESVQHKVSEHQVKQNATHRYTLRNSSRGILSLQEMISIKEAELAVSAKSNFDGNKDSPRSTISKNSSKAKIPKRSKSYYRPKIDLFELSENILGES